MNGVSYLASRLASSTVLCLVRRKVVMVNFGKFDDLLDSSTVNRKGTFEAMCRKSIDSMGSSPSTNFKRTAAEANAAVKFITMKEYLKEYDWNGVYTQNEVDNLLQEEEEDGD